MLNSSIVCIIARELIEATLFITSHVGAVVKSPSLDRAGRFSYLIILIPSILLGIIFGLSISLGVGFGIADAMEEHEEDIEHNAELGEALSKLIGFFFVVDMMLKIPKWFGISNYRKPTEGDEKEGPDDLQLDGRFGMSASLFWNILRETTEGGVMTAMAALLSTEAMNSLGDSIGVGIAAAAGLGIVGAVGAKYVSAVGFGIAAAVLTQVLAMGLITGASRAFEEVYADAHDDATTPIIYDVGHTERGESIKALGFVGVGDFLTVLQLLVWCITLAVLTFLQIYHHYYGKELVPEFIQQFLAQAKSSVFGYEEKTEVKTEDPDDQKFVKVDNVPKVEKVMTPV